MLYWYRHYLAGVLFRVGRMEYMIKPFRGGVVAYRHRDTGEVVALAEDGVRYGREGQVAREGEGEGVWTATLTEDERGAAGYAVSPAGMATRQQVWLPRAQWRRVLGREHNVLQMHIPGGGGMTAIGNIIKDAWVFGILPETETCENWTFDRLQIIHDQTKNEWDKYGCLVSNLPEDLKQKHRRIYDIAIERARGLGWEAAVNNDD